MRHDVRTVETGPMSESLARIVARLTVVHPRGDKEVLAVPRLDDDGRPMGNREERRRAARILRQRARSGASA